MAVVSAGAVYRRDDDVTHSPMFHQIEGFLVDENVSLAAAEGRAHRVRAAALRAGDAGALPAELLPVRRARRRGRRRLRVLPSRRRIARGCRVCKRTGWLEILGCGMIHPEVFEHCGIDSGAVHRVRLRARASSGWRCCATGSRTSACCSRTIRASWRSSSLCAAVLRQDVAKTATPITNTKSKTSAPSSIASTKPTI